MGIWDFIKSGIEYAPDLSPVKNACWSSLSYSCYAVKKIDKAIRADGIKQVYNYWPDGESRAKIGLFAYKFTTVAARHAIKEGVQLLPGGKAVSQIVSKTMRDVESEMNKTQQMKAVETKVGLEQDSTAGTNSINQSELFKQGHGNNVAEYEKPEDVIKNFMATEFVGNQIFADLMVLKAHPVKDSK